MIGVSGSGKTTLARRIARTLDLPHIELDALYWEANWQAASRPAFRRRVQKATAGRAWVVDGNYSQSRDIVWSRATHLVWLDYSLPLVMRRVLWRTLRRLVTRQEMWSGNRESLSNIFGRNSSSAKCKCALLLRSHLAESCGTPSPAIAATAADISRSCIAMSSGT